MSEPIALEELKGRAKAGDVQALQELRDCGFFRDKRARTEGHAVSHAQRRMWIVEQMAEGFGAYNIPIALWLEGDLNVASLRLALRAVIERHESLRTTFGLVHGEVRQHVHDDLPLSWDEVDYRGDPDRDVHARQFATRHATARFNLGDGPLIRAALVRFDDDRHLFLFNIHHIVSDLLSMAVLVNELSALYEAFATGRDAPLPALPVQYKDFADWQNRLLEGDEGARHRTYWHQQLAGPLEPLDFPTDYPRPPLKTFDGKVCQAVLDVGLTERVRQLGLRHGMTLFMVLTAALKVLLHRYTRQEEIIVGFAVAGRDHPDLSGQVGCFVNTVVLRDRLGPDDSFADTLTNVRQTMLEAYEHQVYPFDRLVEELDLPRDMSRSPVFDVAVSFMNATHEVLRFLDVRISHYEHQFASSKFDLSFDFFETGAGIELAITFSRDLFRPESIHRLAESYVRLISEAVVCPDRPIGRLPLISPAEQDQVLVGFNDTYRPFANDKTVVDLFEQRTEETPGAVALCCGGTQLTYGELNRRANQVARLLKRGGVGAEVMVGLFMAPSIDLAAGLLGILKAGGVYLPLDAANPPRRLSGMLEDSRPSVILTQGPMPRRMADLYGGGVIDLEGTREQIAAQPAHNLPRQASPENAAYVIYTSGSTGQPKATIITHQGLFNASSEQARLFGPGPGDRVLQFASIGFDASVFETIMAFGSGAALCLASREQLLPGAALLSTLRNEEITMSLLPPSALSAMADEQLPNLRLIMAGGEACSAEVVRRWAPGRAFFNLYGPTEATIYASLARCDPNGGSPNIGRPIANTRIYLLDERQQPVPLGVPGELCIAGVGLARHYLNHPRMTAERFVPDPFGAVAGARLYRTGDLARYLPDGSIQFLGRIDHQVKLRGFRIEPGEVEATLCQHPHVWEAAVLVREVEPGRQQLAAYVASRAATPPLDARRLRRFLEERLPEYMIPAHFVLLDEMPRTSNQKVDRRALAARDEARPERPSSLVPPRDALEIVLAGYFTEVLRAEQVGVDDNFFELGGDSLLAIQIVSRVRDAFRTEISIPQLFRAGNVASLAESVRAAAPFGQADKIAAAIQRLQAMSDDEKRSLLEKTRTANTERRPERGEGAA